MPNKSFPKALVSMVRDTMLVPKAMVRPEAPQKATISGEKPTQKVMAMDMTVMRAAGIQARRGSREPAGLALGPDSGASSGDRRMRNREAVSSIAILTRPTTA